MSKSKYQLLARLECTKGCPAVLGSPSDNQVIVIGSLLSREEEAKMKKSAKVGVASDERTVRIPKAIFEQAVDKYLTQKAKKC